MRAAVITTDGDVKEIDIPEKDNLSVLQEAVGGFIEGVELQIDYANGDPVYGFVNEEGKLEELPFNSLATALYGAEGDFIAGNFVLVGPTDDEGYTTELPLDTLEYVKKIKVLYERWGKLPGRFVFDKEAS